MVFVIIHFIGIYTTTSEAKWFLSDFGEEFSCMHNLRFGDLYKIDTQTYIYVYAIK